MPYLSISLKPNVAAAVNYDVDNTSLQIPKRHINIITS